ncbi:MAG: hypothetical protein B7Z10_04550 [Rhodobacterales bacterium 32-66-7]|nr:MAG: hypothetical protein B7Z31_06350 [Rhodobacterales bacterium 12-65-15]OYX25993.1 MAG: hypothetical protein B7Z10_04550 [Rhodobacterales bacterium 32-66-7]
MIRPGLLLLAALLAACVARAPAGGFRDAAAPIWSSAAFDPARIEGRWQQVAGFRSPSRAGCGDGAVTFQPAAGGLRIDGRLCLDGKVERVSGLAKVAGPGRLDVTGPADWWVLWVDEGYRTLAIGTPDGSFGFVLDRGPAAADRMTAARQIFDFNGYDVSALRPF